MKRIKTVLYFLFLFLLTVPLIQTVTRWIPEQPLNGAFVLSPKPVYTERTWFDGTSQSATESYFRDRMGFHNTLVRLRNSFCFHVFRQANAHDIIVGKHHYLYEQDYFKAYYGSDYIGTPSIEQKVVQIKQLQDTLAKKGKTLLICIAPDKASFFPEYIPSAYRQDALNPTNYQQFSLLLKQYDINFIDYHALFIRNKKDTPYPLYPQYGIHWSYYGMLGAMDSLITRIEQLRGITLSHPVYDGFPISDKLQFSDYDLGKTLNLAGKLSTYPMCYPIWHWKTDTTLAHPSMLVIADSYYWDMFNAGLQVSCFSGSFWYYNATAYPESYQHEAHPADFDLTKTIDKTEVIVIMSTSVGLHDFSWGFLKQCYKEKILMPDPTSK